MDWVSQKKAKQMIGKSFFIFIFKHFKYWKNEEYMHMYMKFSLFHYQDTGISVRKRVIKIFRDICLEQPDFPKIPEMCVKMIRRVNDEEGIKVMLTISD